MPALLRLLQQPVAYADAVLPRAPYLKLASFVPPGNDEFPEEAQAMAAQGALEKAIRTGTLPSAPGFTGKSLVASSWQQLGSFVSEAKFENAASRSDADFSQWLASLGEIGRTRFFVLPGDLVRFEISSRKEGKLIYASGLWKVSWRGTELASFGPLEETRAMSDQPWFRDVTGSVFAGCSAFKDQLALGVPYWRARLDPASGIDIYGSNGIAVGDIDNDGVDEIYVCQPGGLPNKLFRFREGRFEDISEQWGVALLDDTSTALFLDLRNTGRQDLVVLRDSGPLLYLNEGTHYRLRDDAFRFAAIPQGGFTGMAAADYNRDGKLDLYLCTYVYFQSEAQYTYPVPYHDAQNGPPNFLFRNGLAVDGSGAFEDVTMESGINQNNNRFSFAPSWCDVDNNGWPDLYVANDFGRNNFYKNENGHFADVAAQAGIEDLGPGMSSCWFDYDGDGRPDLYVGNMWSAAGQRIAHSPHFAPAQGSAEFAEAYRRHTAGNSLFRNNGNGTFENVTEAQQVAMGRWAWSSIGHDMNNDGVPEILVGCGMLSNINRRDDLMSFFWRQVVARSPQRAQPSTVYENGWNAINQFTREDFSWNGHEPNVMYAKQGNRFYDVSGISGFDHADDTRAFAVADFDNDGRPDLILKSRLGPQVRVLQNNCALRNHSIGFELCGTKSNRDAIGAKITVGERTVWVTAASGYLSQHSKRVLIGLGQTDAPVNVKIIWPSGTIDEHLSLAPGYVYQIAEGATQCTKKPFAASKPLAETAFPVDNTPRLHTGWLIESVPLPQKVQGPALLVLTEGVQPSIPQGRVQVIDLATLNAGQRESWRIFRRYLFDYRQNLKTPFALLLDENGRAAKVYAETLSADILTQDLKTVTTAPPLRGLPFAGSYHKQPRRDYFKFAAALLWENQTEAALPYLEEAIRQGSSNPRIPLLIGQIYLEAGRTDEAETYIRQSIAANPSNADAWLELGGVFDARNNSAEALRCYEHALSLQPDFGYLLVSAAQAAEKTSASEKAREYYQHALQVDPKNPDAANGLGLMLAKAGQTNQAKVLFEQAIQERRDYGSAINNLGVLYMNIGQLNDAIAAFQYGLEAAPDEEILYLNLARIYARQNEKERARGVMQQLLARKPGNSTAERALRELEQR